MAYVISEPCIATKDASCVDVCPVDCIHPTPDEPGFAYQRAQIWPTRAQMQSRLLGVWVPTPCWTRAGRSRVCGWT